MGTMRPCNRYAGIRPLNAFDGPNAFGDQTPRNAPGSPTGHRAMTPTSDRRQVLPSGRSHWDIRPNLGGAGPVPKPGASRWGRRPRRLPGAYVTQTMPGVDNLKTIDSLGGIGCSADQSFRPPNNPPGPKSRIARVSLAALRDPAKMLDMGGVAALRSTGSAVHRSALAKFFKVAQYPNSSG